jgi:hypothetical protein
MFNRLTYGFWGTPHFRRNLPTWKSDAVTSNDRPFTISQQIPNNPPRQKNTQSAVATRLPDRRNCHCCATSFHYTDWLIKIRSLSLYMNIYISLSRNVVNQLKELPLSASSFTTFGEKKNLTQTIQHQQKVVSTKHVWSLYGIFILRYFPHHISNTSSIDQPFTNKRGPRRGLNFRGRLSLWILRLLIGPPVARWASVCVVCWGGFLLPKLTSRNPGNIKYKKKH